MLIFLTRLQREGSNQWARPSGIAFFMKREKQKFKVFDYFVEDMSDNVLETFFFLHLGLHFQFLAVQFCRVKPSN